MRSANDVVDQTYRAHWGRLLSLLVARTRRLDLAEDALSEAFARASSVWPTAGVPESPSGWLYTTAYRQVVAGLRSEAVRGRKAPLLAVDARWVHPSPEEGLDELADERLSLILLCCHPALAPEARSALALRLVIGTSTAEIARLFLVSQSTMAARITRAKRKILTAGIPLSLPVDEELQLRLSDVGRTIYLAFTAGYSPGEGANLLRADLASEAVELAAVLHRLVPGSSQCSALYGLLLLQHARRDARVHNRTLVTLADQDRSLWRPEELRVGAELVNSLAPTTGYAEELRLQALIAAQHAIAATSTDTNWRQIAALYSELEQLTGSPVVRLNRAVAVAEAEGPAQGLPLLDAVADLLWSNHRFHSVRADLARRSGDTDLARSSYEEALRRCSNDLESQFLADRLASL